MPQSRGDKFVLEEERKAVTIRREIEEIEMQR